MVRKFSCALFLALSLLGCGARPQAAGEAVPGYVNPPDISQVSPVEPGKIAPAVPAPVSWPGEGAGGGLEAPKPGGSGERSPARPRISFTPPFELLPGAGLPAGLDLMRSANNVDCAWHDGKAYMAFRTAPTHFASTRTVLHILSSTDAQNWKLEKTVHQGADMREPRFLSFKGELHFYWFKGGSNPLAFEPDRMYRSTLGPGGWSEAEEFYEPGYVPWRARVVGDRAIMSVYYGRGLYMGQKTGSVRLLASDDGRKWEPISAEPQVTEPSAEEPEFEFDLEGNLWATVRLENVGALIAFAPKGDLSKWTTVKTRDKYDSALLFRHGSELYLLARRNVDGEMDKAPSWWPSKLRVAYNLARYSLTRKRTAIYRLDRVTRTISHLFDFPSHGDTAFPALMPLDAKRYLFLNYSSELGKGDYPWIWGQLQNTRIYSSILTFE
jgi:hypothetical protein